MKTLIRNGLGWIAILWLSCTMVWGKGISVDLNASDIEEGQQIRLTLTYDPHEAHGTPDLNVLQADFTIVGTEQSMSYTVMNGQARSIGQWGIVLKPKHSGMITIPAFQIGSLTSVPVQLNVRARSQTSPQPALTQPQQTVTDLKDDVALKVEVDNKSPYLNQEVLYKVSLITRHQLVDVRYQAPQVEDAISLPIGEGQQYQTVRKGVAYQVDEQIYAIFPQKSGPIRIIPPVLHALRYNGTPQPVTLKGDPVTLDVQPLPKHFIRREWLPSKLVRLRETYDQGTTQFVEGDTLVRTVELQAQGLVAQLLPQIPFPERADLRTYPEQAEQDNRIQQGELWGRAKLKVTYVFPRPGKVMLPAIRVPWFNVKTQKLEIAELPAKAYDIHSSSPSKKTKPAKPKLLKTVLTSPSMPASKTISWEVKPIFLLWSAGIVAILGGLFGAWYWHRRRVRPSRSLRAACKANDIEHTKSALLAWGKSRWPNKDLSHFTDILPLIPKQEPFHAALETFIAAVYHPEHARRWQGASLWQAIVVYKKHYAPKKTKRTRASAMPPIHSTRK